MDILEKTKEETWIRLRREERIGYGNELAALDDGGGDRGFFLRDRLAFSSPEPDWEVLWQGMRLFDQSAGAPAETKTLAGWLNDADLVFPEG